MFWIVLVGAGEAGIEQLLFLWLGASSDFFQKQIDD
jgi:hypothetical protein